MKYVNLMDQGQFRKSLPWFFWPNPIKIFKNQQHGCLCKCILFRFVDKTILTGGWKELAFFKSSQVEKNGQS